MTRCVRVGLVTYAMHCGGVETFLLRLGKYLDRSGFDVEVITTLETGAWFGQLSRVGLKADHVGGYAASALLNPLIHSLRVGRRLVTGKYDAVLLNHSRHAQACLGLLPDSVTVVPILHNDTKQVYSVGCANDRAWNVSVAVSPKVCQAARDRVADRPVVMIPYGVETPSGIEWSTRAHLGRKLRLAFVGRLVHSQKGVLFLPDILKGCLDRGIDAVLAVGGAGPDFEQLRKKVSCYGLQEEVSFAGELPPERVYDLLLDSHILIMPSYYEGLPIVPLEAQACGCVPVVSRLQQITDYGIEDGRTGILAESENVQEFIEAIERLYYEPTKWREMSEAGHRRVARRFSVDAMGQAYSELIIDALDGRYPLPRSRRLGFPLDLSLFSADELVPKRLLPVARRVRQWLRRTFLPSKKRAADRDLGSHRGTSHQEDDVTGNEAE